MEAGCRLCASPSATVWRGSRQFLRCPQCDLIFVSEESLPSLDLERGRYLSHRNSADDPGYCTFLGRAIRCLEPRLTPGMRGLDYGCGPGPVLAQLLSQAGFPTAGYDPIFAPEHGLLEKKYDFVTCTETAEHFHHPSREFPKLAQLLEKGSQLLIMTQFFDDKIEIGNWYYARDPTHVAFYSANTMKWIGRSYGWECDLPAPNIAIFRR